MKQYSKLFFAALFLMSFFILGGHAAAKDFVAKEPPKSMDKLFAPESKDNKWIAQMQKVAGDFSGVFVDVQEKDWTNAEKHATQLVESYKELAKLVPEWKDYYDHKAVEAFAATVKSHDGEKAGAAAKEVGKTCGKCHKENLVAVWTKYHWPTVDTIKMTDPIDEKETKYGKYMGAISMSFNAVTVNFGDGQYERAKKALPVFKKRYMELKSTCAKCHTNDAVKQLFVGDNVAKAFEGLQTELDAAKPDSGKFWKNVGVIGVEGCRTCHMVHRSSMIVQDTWEAK